MLDRRKVVGIFRRLVLEQQADWLPRDVEITLWLYNVDDPTSRHPAPRSNRIYPKFNVHDRTLPKVSACRDV